MATTIPHRIPTLQHAIADLTGYEDADTLRWQPPCTGAQDGDASTGPDERTPRGPAPTGSPASWHTSEAPASMNVKLKVGNMELMYTARDTNDRDLQDRMTRLLPWLAEVMAACEANDEARQQATARRHQQTEEERQAQARSLDEQIAAAVQAAMRAQASGHNGHSPQQGNAAPPQPPDAERLASAPDHEPSWCPTHQVTMRWHEGNARGPGWFSHQLTDGRYCKGK